MLLTALCKRRFMANAYNKQLLRIMKLTAVFLLLVCLTVSASGTGQSISLHVKDAPLEKVFEEIKKQSGYSFVYTKDMVNKARRVTLKLHNKNLDEVLQLCLLTSRLLIRSSTKLLL
jgi:hypothetical protein